MLEAKCFHEIFFNGLFGRLVLGSKSAGGKREFLLQKDTKSFWSPRNLYLLLPLDKSKDICSGSLRIKWSAISSCASAVEFFRRKFSLVAGDSDDNSKILSPSRDTTLSDVECESTNKIYFANCAVDVSKLKDTVVLAIHTGKMYCITEVVVNSSAESPFDGSEGKSEANGMTFSKFFQQRCIICFI